MSVLGNALTLGGGGGGGSAPILVLGAKNETVTYSGSASGTVILGEDGSGRVSLSSGTYSFSGGVSGYVKSNVVVDSSTSIIYVRPVGTIYWYGAIGETGAFAVSSTTSTGIITYNSDTFKWVYPTETDYSTLFTNVDGTGYTSCTVLSTATGTSTTCYLAYDDTIVTNPSSLQYKVAVSNTSAFTAFTLTFVPDSTGSTIRLHGAGYSTRSVTVKEWYLGDR